MQLLKDNKIICLTIIYFILYIFFNILGTWTMTRYAKIKGPQNRKSEEEATPWNELKIKSKSKIGSKNVYHSEKNTENRIKNGRKTNEYCDRTDTERGKIKPEKKFKNKRLNSKNTITNKTMNPIAWNTSNLNSTELSDAEDNVTISNEKKQYKRRKPITDIPPIFVNGDETRIARFEGFPVKKNDAERLKDLKRKLIAMKVPHTELVATLKAERRRAEKVLARERKKICFHCRHSGHMLSQCPQLANVNDDLDRNASGICFKCGSTEHQHNQCKMVRDDSYKFATCFICNEEGHISKQCPDNPRGLYPHGGACRMCGDVTHLKKDCPQSVVQKREEFDVTADIINKDMPDALEIEDFNDNRTTKVISTKKRKIIKMNK